MKNRKYKFYDHLLVLSRTIATHPASTIHSKLSDEEKEAVNITPGMIRIAVGLEAIEDIQQDIDQALSKS